MILQACICHFFQVLTVDNLKETQECIVSQTGAVIPVSEPSNPPETEQEPPKSPDTPEPPKEIIRLVPGYLALCPHCGYLSEDFNRCQRCRTKMPDEPKAVPTTATMNKQVQDKKDALGAKTVKVPLTAAAKLTPKPNSKLDD